MFLSVVFIFFKNCLHCLLHVSQHIKAINGKIIRTRAVSANVLSLVSFWTTTYRYVCRRRWSNCYAYFVWLAIPIVLAAIYQEFWSHNIN